MDSTSVKSEYDNKNQQSEICISVALLERICHLSTDEKTKFIEIVSRVPVTTTLSEFETSKIEALKLLFPSIEEKDVRRIMIGGRIKRLRREKGVTQELLAAKCGLSQTHISQIEHFNKVPQAATIQIIAAALEVPVNDIDIFSCTD